MSKNLKLQFVDNLAYLGIFLFVSGGVYLNTAFGHQRILLEINEWGLAFLPLAVVAIFFPKYLNGLGIVKALKSVKDSLNDSRVAFASLAVVSLLHLAAMMMRYMSFQAGWDLGIYANACSNNLHSSFRYHTTLMADHFEPVLALLVPACQSFGAVPVLLGSQVIAWMFGAWGIRKFSMLKGLDGFSSSLVMFAYILFAGHQTISYVDFHPYGWALGTIPWMMVALHGRHYVGFILLALFHLGLKENASLFIAGLGLWLIFQNQRRLGVVTCLLGIVSFIVIMKCIFPYFRDGADSQYFAKYYGYIGSTMEEFLVNGLTKPWIVLAPLVEYKRLVYYSVIFSPFLFFVLFRPIYLLPLAGSILIAVLSTNESLYSASFHYEAEIYPWLFVSQIYLIRDELFRNRLSKFCSWIRVSKDKMLRSDKLLSIWLVTLMIFFTGSSPVGRLHAYTPTRQHVEMHLKLKEIEEQLADCKIAAVERVAEHLADVRHITLLDDEEKADAIIVGYPRGDSLWNSNLETIEKAWVPQWDQTYAKREQPLTYDRDFRVWTKPPCKGKL